MGTFEQNIVKNVNQIGKRKKKKVNENRKQN